MPYDTGKLKFKLARTTWLGLPAPSLPALFGKGGKCYHSPFVVVRWGGDAGRRIFVSCHRKAKNARASIKKTKALYATTDPRRQQKVAAYDLRTGKKLA